ncbi:chaperonin 10-like protein [Stachybotrys elegans]|uniref:Chaperonin 10-like protein n=1 Tax=Stachybotrys elegans TaxID=80388 RepID=A0A8K0SFH8_9HYPO|nr:chaperonin 10-like protein [Stachybotrys elegans]
MKALVLTTATRTTAVEDLPIPTPAAGEILVRVHAIALNPVDTLYTSKPIAAQPQRVVGTDFAGVVVEAAANLAASSDARTKPGARVSGFLQGACSVNDRPGAFAEYLVISYDLVWLVPESLSLEDASAISMCGLTAAQGLFTRLDLPAPFGSDPKSRPALAPATVFIYGASTSLGLYAAQLVRASARASGRHIRLVGAASASKHQLLRQEPYSYDALVDYRDPSWPEKVRAAALGGNGVQYALDCISEGETVAKVHSTFADDVEGDGHFGVFRAPAGGGYQPQGLRVKPVYGAAWEALGVEVGYNGFVLPANPEARAFGVTFYNYLSASAPSGAPVLQPNPVRLMPGGLERVVPDGFELLGSLQVSARSATSGRTETWMRPVSGEKIVYSLGVAP